METTFKNWIRNTCESEEDGQDRYVEDEDHQDLLQILRGIIEELNLEGREMFEKLISDVGNNTTIDRLLTKTLRGCRGKRRSHMLENLLSKIKNRGAKNYKVFTERGLDGDSISPIELKIERFKVKTVNIKGSGVVKEEGE
ncbi:hypothetical protein OROMI_002098 [Orobanche minor]